MSGMDAVKKKRFHDKLTECFQVVNTCLRTYYKGETHMYLPLAGQLRILFCDTNQGKEIALLGRVFSGFALEPLDEIRWIEPGSVTVSYGYPYAINWDSPPGQEWRIAEMPFRITRYSN